MLPALKRIFLAKCKEILEKTLRKNKDIERILQDSRLKLVSDIFHFFHQTIALEQL